MGKIWCSCGQCSAQRESLGVLDKGQGCNDAIFGSNLDVSLGQEHVTCEPQGCNHLLWLQSESPLDTPAAGSGQEFFKKTIILIMKLHEDSSTNPVLCCESSAGNLGRRE